MSEQLPRCAVCGEESYQLLPRQGLLTVQCCPRCARKIDSEQQEQNDTETMKSLSKLERKALAKERAHEWAWSWNNKHVVVSFPVQVYALRHPDTFRIRGMAYDGTKHEDVGYGRVKVIIDPDEQHRISLKPFNGRPDYLLPAVDGHLFALALIEHGSDRNYEEPYCFWVNWGDRDRLVLEEFDEGTERQRVDRLQAIEASKHMAEGI